LAGSLAIGGRANKRESYIIDPLRKAEAQITPILLSQRRRRQGDVGYVDPFVLAERASIDNVADDIGGGALFDAELNQPIGEKNTMASMDILWQIDVAGRDNRCVARTLRVVIVRC
jgi:hypothetical protein